MKDDQHSNGLWLRKGAKQICYNPWTHFEVNNPNGNVTMCCLSNKILGNVNNQTIEEIWNGSKYQRERQLMYKLGAEKMCGRRCLLLNGAMNYQSFAWYRKINAESELSKNALINESEIANGEKILVSYPRWIRFALSYDCNYNCYHCEQENDRKKNIKLTESFIKNVKNLSVYCQFLVIFGGEPTILPEFPELLNAFAFNRYLKYGIISNGSNIHKYFSEIRKIQWAFIMISLDAACAEDYKLFRKSNLWERVNRNIKELSNLKKKKSFELILSMTVNSKNCMQIYDFTKLAFQHNATPKIYLVSNPNNSLDFTKQYLIINKKQKKIILSQIEKVKRDYSSIYNDTGLNVLREQLLSYEAKYILRAAWEREE